MFLKVLILLLFHNCFAQLNVFEVDYMGNQLTVDEYKKLDICLSVICLRDVKKFIFNSSHKNGTDPCVDFSEFACGHFFDYRAPNDRYLTVGFESNLITQHYEYLRRILKKKIQENEPKIFKIVKNYYQKCVNSTYVRTEGKAEFKSILYEFGKFPIFEENWNPSDFNVTNVLISGYKDLLSFEVKPGNPTVVYVSLVDAATASEYDVDESIKNILNVDFYLAKDLITEISSDYKHYQRLNYAFIRNLTTTIENLDSYLNITSGLDWLQIIKSLNKNVDITKETEVKFYRIRPTAYDIFDLKNRRKLANLFTMFILVPKLEYFSVYTKPLIRKRSKNRYEQCIDTLNRFVKFPLEVMYQKEYGSEQLSKAFKEFTAKYLTIQPLVGWHPDNAFKGHESAENFTVIVGYPHELTTPEFLNTLYANLSLTGNEGFYKMSQEMINYSDLILQNDYRPAFMENFTENAKRVFRNCRKNEKVKEFEFEFVNSCDLGFDLQMFKVRDILYPVFHPERPYYVNLVYLFSQIAIRGIFYHRRLRFDLQSHYLKYEELFGKEQNLPGFLLTNLQMLEVIYYQSQCSKHENGCFHNPSPPDNIFNCPLDVIKVDEHKRCGSYGYALIGAIVG